MSFNRNYDWFLVSTTASRWPAREGVAVTTEAASVATENTLVELHSIIQLTPGANLSVQDGGEVEYFLSTSVTAENLDITLYNGLSASLNVATGTWLLIYQVLRKNVPASVTGRDRYRSQE